MRDKQFRALTRSERIEWEITETVWGTCMVMGYIASPMLLMWLEKYVRETLKVEIEDDG
jgi:hypothetical protein